MHTYIALDKVELACTDIVRSKPTINDTGFVT